MKYALYHLTLLCISIGSVSQNCFASEIADITINAVDHQNSDQLTFYFNDEIFMDYATLYIARTAISCPLEFKSYEEALRFRVKMLRSESYQVLSQPNIDLINEAIKITEDKQISGSDLKGKLISLEKTYPTAYPFITEIIELRSAVDKRSNCEITFHNFLMKTSRFFHSIESNQKLLDLYLAITAVTLREHINNEAYKMQGVSLISDYNLKTNYVELAEHQLEYYKSLLTNPKYDFFDDFMHEAIPVLDKYLLKLNETVEKKKQLLIYAQMQTELFRLCWKYPSTSDIMYYPYVGS